MKRKYFSGKLSLVRNTVIWAGGLLVVTSFLAFALNDYWTERSIGSPMSDPTGFWIVHLFLILVYLLTIFAVMPLLDREVRQKYNQKLRDLRTALTAVSSLYQDLESDFSVEVAYALSLCVNAVSEKACGLQTAVLENKLNLNIRQKEVLRSCIEDSTWLMQTWTVFRSSLRVSLIHAELAKRSLRLQRERVNNALSQMNDF